MLGKSPPFCVAMLFRRLSQHICAESLSLFAYCVNYAWKRNIFSHSYLVAFCGDDFSVSQDEHIVISRCCNLSAAFGPESIKNSRCGFACSDRDFTPPASHL